MSRDSNRSPSQAARKLWPALNLSRSNTLLPTGKNPTSSPSPSSKVFPPTSPASIASTISTSSPSPRPNVPKAKSPWTCSSAARPRHRQHTFRSHVGAQNAPPQLAQAFDVDRRSGRIQIHLLLGRHGAIVRPTRVQLGPFPKVLLF